MSITSIPRLAFVWFFVLLSYARLGVDAYIPASPVNSTASALNGTDSASRLNLMWLGGNYGEDVSYQLVGANSTGVSKVRSWFFARIVSVKS